MNHFDLVIVGGGAGAFAAAIRANELSASVALINSGLPLGGTCVNVGCVPSKTLLWAAEVLHTARHHNIPGIQFEMTRFDFAEVVQHEIRLVEGLREEKYSKVLQQLQHVTVFDGKAKFVSAKTVEVNGTRITGEHFIIAVGSTATAPAIRGLRELGFITHVEALTLRRQPRELIVIGAGPLGLEFAQLFARFGTSVTILHRGPTILPHSEAELTARLTEILRSENIAVETSVNVQSAGRDGEKKSVRYAVGNEERSVIADEIFVAAGKTPNTEDLGLDVAGVAVDERKAIVVSRSLQTSQDYIYAVGDVTNLPMRLEATAGHEGTLAAENALNGSQEQIDYDSVPYTIFSDPQLAGVGVTEEEQMRRFGTCMCKTVSFKDVPKALIIGRTEGLIKMAIHPKTKQIMGVHILAPHAGELIAEAMMLIRNRNTIEDLVHSLPMFPTLSESIKLAALSFTRDITKLSCCT
jgi:mercuric reductase